MEMLAVLPTTAGQLVAVALSTLVVDLFTDVVWACALP